MRRIQAVPRLPLALAFLVAMCFPVEVRAQFMSVEGGGSRSDYRELADPWNLGARIAIPMGSTFSLTGSYRRVSDGQEWERSRCSGLVPPDQVCPDEVFKGEFTMTSWGLGALVDASLTDRVDVYVGVDWARYSVDGDWTSTESDARVGVFPDDNATGWAYYAGVFVRYWENAGISLTARRDRPDFSTCGEDAYFPFCDARVITALDLGLQWKPRVRRR